ncbi:ferritin [Kribbella albertanoniae]|uniref:Ferritin n=1 Tax=Kribbella albertanoniae TaxID=1266829 RepID=A0A4R4PLV3_9ACTN|nr:ferritin [Kribbella albertanoniae]TDC23082.1 ferritin [Kribbella albertanoniae]
MSTYEKLLQEQIRNEFTASQQYVAVAVWFDDQDLPRLAAHFYKQALEERNHAMMMVQYLLDKDIRPHIPGVGEVASDFKTALEPLELALQQEITVTKQIETLARTARDESDYVGEQFMQWFLKEQVEEVSAMNTLVNVAKRAGDNLFHLEDFLARETVGDNGNDPTAPTAAGGTV